MSYNRWPQAFFVLFLSLFRVAQAECTEIKCPSQYKGELLSSVQLFDGPPEAKADLEPEWGGYHGLNAPGARVSAYLNLMCNYAGLKSAMIIVLPASVRECLFSKPAPQVSCR